MTIPLFASYILGVLCIASAASVFVVTIPNFVRSMIRYRFWRIRDEIVDDIVFNRLPNVKAVRELVQGIETTCAEAPTFSLLKWVLYPRMPEDKREHYQAMISEALSTMDDTQRSRFKKYQKRVYNNFTNLLMLGSLSGWIAISVAILPALAVVLYEEIVKWMHQTMSKTQYSFASAAWDKCAKVTPRDWLSSDSGMPPMCHS